MVVKYVDICDLDIEKIKDIVSKLETWRNVRHIEMESQKPSLFANILEEMTELERAKLSKNVHEMIDAYCDIIVFTLNACDINKTIDSKSNDRPLVSLYKFDMDEEYVFSYSMNLVSGICNAIEEFKIYKDKCEYYEAYRLVALCLSFINSLNYDPYGCLNETIKEISSRTGTWNESIKKFVKDTSDEAKAKWYKANYELCKRS